MLTKSLFVKQVIKNFTPTPGPDCPTPADAVLQKEEFKQAAEFVYDNYLAIDTMEWDSERFLHFFQQVHQRLAKNMLSNQGNLPGEFRDSELYVLRKNEQNCGYGESQVKAMSLYLAKEGYDKKVIKNFFTAFHKFFYVDHPKVAPLRAKFHGEAIINYVKETYAITITDEDLATKVLTEQENTAFNIIYKQYAMPDTLVNDMEKLTGEIIAKSQTQDPSVASDFFYGFWLIKPYLDANSRFAKLIANALLVKHGGPVINLDAPVARAVYEYRVGKEFSLKELHKLIQLLVEQEKDALVKEKDIVDALGAGFKVKYPNPLSWKIQNTGFSGTAELTNFKLTEASKKWFEKQLSKFDIDFIQTETNPAKYHLVVENVDFNNFKDQPYAVIPRSIFEAFKINKKIEKIQSKMPQDVLLITKNYEEKYQPLFTHLKNLAETIIRDESVCNRHLLALLCIQAAWGINVKIRKAGESQALSFLSLTEKLCPEDVNIQNFRCYIQSTVYRGNDKFALAETAILSAQEWHLSFNLAIRAHAANNLALTLLRQNKFIEAQSILEALLPKLETALFPTVVDNVFDVTTLLLASEKCPRLRTFMNLAQVYEKIGEFKKAENFAREVLKAFSTAEHSPLEIAYQQNILAEILLAQQDPVDEIKHIEAVSLLHQAEDNYKKCSGENTNNQNYARILTNLALAYQKQSVGLEYAVMAENLCNELNLHDEHDFRKKLSPLLSQKNDLTLSSDESRLSFK